MKLAPMRYKGFIWPHNPRVYTIEYSREMSINKVPFGLYHLQNLGRTRRVMRGEGEFAGEDAYEQFGKLAAVFYEEGVGTLVHPLWQVADAYFVSLKLKQEPRPDYVQYSFEFWEGERRYQGNVTETGAGQTEQGATEGPVAAQEQKRVHTVVSGDTLWVIGQRYSKTVQELLAMNPQIKNPNLIYPGNEVRVG